MKPITYCWASGESNYLFGLIYVRGAGGDPYRFGEGDASRSMEVGEFWIATTPTTRAICALVMGEGRNPAIGQGPRLPVENVSWDELHRPGGFLDRINVSNVRTRLSQQASRPAAVLRLPFGLYDMSGNVWEWCEDAYTPDVKDLPADGRPYCGDGSERVLRGGCFHNWAMHCTVLKRYQIDRQFHDGCIGFRLMLSPGRTPQILDDAR